MAMREPISSTHPERRASAERRDDSRRSLYDRLDATMRKIEADRRRARRRRDDGRAARRLSLDEALQVAADVAKAENPQLAVVGLTGFEGSSRYIEMPIALKGCHVEPCRLSIGFDRTISPTQLRETVQRRIREHLRERPH